MCYQSLWGRMQNAMKITITCTGAPPSDLYALFWGVFFASRRRGVSLERHFPWIAHEREGIAYFQALESDHTVGGLVVFEKQVVSGSRKLRIGLVGLVCVREAYRGKGISSALLEAAIEYAGRRQLDYLTLWTSKHAVYERHLFVVCDDWNYGWVDAGSATSKGADGGATDIVGFREDMQLPLPPFAKAVHRYSSDECSVTLVEDAEGLIVADYSGPPEAAAATMILCLPGRWRLNARSGDPLLAALRGLYARVSLAAVNLQMWRNVVNETPCNMLEKDIFIPILERI